ncbi:MAG: O-acetyl-ADP-ribose deacetylase [Terasakiella sp.]|uniref:O-acetyl-ADP-ribose deacetylase n=1 Tax=unclassified Terasakiella TaxID=2614952 RepID=UPI003B00E495
MTVFSVKQGDITKLDVDVIVNAANETLLGGGGVDGAIHRAAGKSLLEECHRLNGCQTGEAKLTGGHNLPARHVIHAVGPIWQQHTSERADQLLLNCYFNSLRICLKKGLQSIAFPCISTGAYGFPSKRAAQLVVKNVIEFCKIHPGLEQVIFCCFDIESKTLYDQAFHEVVS